MQYKRHSVNEYSVRGQWESIHYRNMVTFSQTVMSTWVGGRLDWVIDARIEAERIAVGSRTKAMIADSSLWFSDYGVVYSRAFSRRIHTDGPSASLVKIAWELHGDARDRAYTRHPTKPGRRRSVL